MSGSQRQARKWTAGLPLSIGYLAIVALVGGLGVWSVNAKISGAVVSSGMIQVESNRQVIQHPEGGVVGDILVKNGDRVAAGDVLLRLDDTLLTSELAIVEGQLFELFARRARLVAERDGTEDFAFSAGAARDFRENPQFTELLQGQERLFHARRDALAQETAQLEEQILQASNQIQGAQSQLSAFIEQEQLVAEELSDIQSLFDKGLTQANRLTAQRREHSRLKGEIGNFQSNIALLKGEIAGLEIQKLRLQTQTREEAITGLRDIGHQELELSERRLALLETLSRLDIRTPVSGVIYDSQIFAIQSVISPAQPIMFVIPQDQPLVVASRVESIHIDQVHVGQDVSLRFSAFDQRFTPEIQGQVSRLSADVFTDDVTGLSYYQAELLPLEGELAKLEGQELLPGMPVEAFIKTSERSPLNYLTKPLVDYFNKAFRED
jgi:HlyD family secretion protein